LHVTSDYETGRPANIDEESLVRVHDHDDVARVIEQMRTDLLEHPAEWENNTLARYLEALAAVLEALPALYTNRGEPLPEAPTWRMVAEALVWATGYE
jgi:hypothetical protein